jgi:hypothetical protein
MFRAQITKLDQQIPNPLCSVPNAPAELDIILVQEHSPAVSVKRTAVRILVWAAMAYALLFMGVCALIHTTTKPPKEERLLQNFQQHRAAFEQLRDMLNEDINLSRVGTWGIDRRHPFFLGYPTENEFPKDRFGKYQALLKEAGAGVASRREGEKVEADPSVVVWGCGFAGNTHHIGICWLNHAPTNQIPTLDGYRGPAEDSVAYRHIDSNWYLWTDL